jgi:hypothetical protein
MANNPNERERLSRGSRQRVFQLGAWPGKIAWLLDLYHSILREQINSRRSA